RRGGRAQLRRQRVRGKALEATVQHYVGVQILQGLEASLCHIRCAVLDLDTLNGLKGIQVVAVGRVVRDDQVREVTATDQLHPQRVHLLHDGCGRQNAVAVSCGRPSLVLPELPLRAVNAANGDRRRRAGNEQLKAAHGAGDRTVAVDAL